MITTRDIARAAGVSQSTVSRALRNDPGAGVETCRRLQELALSMGYRPNPLVSALMASQRSGTPSQRHVMAYLTTDREFGGWKWVHTFAAFHEGAVERAASYGFDLQEFWLREPRMTGRRMSEILFHRNIQAVLIAPLNGSTYNAQRSGMGHVSLNWSRFSAAALGHSLIRPRLHRAAHHNLLGIRTALRHVRKLGYRRPGLALHTSHDARVDHIWSLVFSDYLRSQPPSDRTTPFLRSSSDFHFKEFLRWYRQQRPDVIIAGSAEVFNWMQEAGIEVPGETGYVILDLPATHDFPVKLAGINQNSKAIGAAAVDLIVGQLHGNERGLPRRPMTTLIDGEWTDGATLRELPAMQSSAR